MRRLHNFLKMPASEKLLLGKITLLLWAVRFGLWLLPFQKLRRILERWSTTAKTRQGERVNVRQVVRGVKAVSRYVPQATCLTRALTTQLLLLRGGQPAALRIGVAKDDDGKFEAHAWVESGGKIVIGELADLSRYSPMSQVKKEV